MQPLAYQLGLVLKTEVQPTVLAPRTVRWHTSLTGDQNVETSNRWSSVISICTYYFYNNVTGLRWGGPQCVWRALKASSNLSLHQSPGLYLGAFPNANVEGSFLSTVYLVELLENRHAFKNHHKPRDGALARFH